MANYVRFLFSITRDKNAMLY